MGFIEGVVNDYRRISMTRKQSNAEDRLSSLAVNEAQGFRLPISFGNDSFLLSDKAAWTGFHVPAKPWGFLDQESTRDHFRQADQVFAGQFPSEKGNQGQILVTNQVYSPDDWEQALVQRHARQATPNFAPFIKATRKAIAAREFFERETYMFVRLGDRGGHGGVRGKLRQGMEYAFLGAGIEDTYPDVAEIADWDLNADTVADTLVNSWLNAIPINRRRVEWMVRHIDSPGLPTPETIASADGEEWGIGHWRTVLSSYTRRIDLGRVGRSRYSAIEFDSPVGGGKTYAAFLPLAHVPPKVVFNQNWLHHASSLSFPVDASVRFEIIDPDRALRQIQRPINQAEAQAEEDADADVRPDETTQIQQEQLRQVKTQTKMGRRPFTRWQVVFCVYDTDPDELRSKITQLIKHYKDIKFDLVNPPKDQRELFYQSFPGGEIEVEDWIHRTSTEYLASAMPWLTSTVGDKDGSGLYQGYTVVRDATGQNYKRGSPVFYDLLNVVDDEQRAPTEAVAAESGSGKTVSRGLKSAYEDYHRGITQFIWDPKGDFLSLVKYAEWMRLDPAKIKLVNLKDQGTSVSLDPFGIAEVDFEDPMNPVDDRESSAMDVLKTLLNQQLAESRLAGESLLRNAVRGELAKESELTRTQIMERRSGASDRPIEEEPCLEGLMNTLRRWGQPGSDIPADEEHVSHARFMAKSLLDTLSTLASSTLGRLLFRRPSTAGALKIERGDLMLFVAINMNTTEPGEEPTEKTILPDVISGMMTDYIRSMLYILPDHYEKCATFDEWHVIKRSARADALLKWLRRMGRSKRCMVRQMSQSALDFYNPSDPTSSRTSLATVWCGHVDDDDEARASCELLGIEKSRANISTLKGLGKGQFLFRDSFGRVAFVQVDIWDEELLKRFATDAKDNEEALLQSQNG